MTRSRTTKTPRCRICGCALEAGMIRHCMTRISPQVMGGVREYWLCVRHAGEVDDAIATVRETYFGPDTVTIGV